MHLKRLIFASLCVLTLGVLPAAETIPDLQLLPVASGLQQPLQVVNAGDGSGRLFAVERDGRLKEFHAEGKPTTVFDLVTQVEQPNGYHEEGLLSVAFHPQFATNRAVFAYYSKQNPKRTRLSRFTWPKDAVRVDSASEQVVLEVAQPHPNHKGGTILFGQDGMLYLSLGDGGSGGDPSGNGQKLDTLLAKVLRLDVDHPTTERAYGIPADNPFVKKAGARPEIWAYGLRNVWRMSVDRQTGAIWAADVGQDQWEEIDVIVKGGNYGWNIREGTHPFRDGKRTPDMIEPILDYGHDQGKSITGGFVYRGRAIAGLQGVYLYGDYQNGRVWGVRVAANGADGTSQKVTAQRQLLDTRLPLASFGEDEAGELYVVGLNGEVSRIVSK